MFNKIKNLVKNRIKKYLFSRGYSLVRTNGQIAHKTMENAFATMQNKQYRFNTVIDVGASNGCWSESLMKYFPLCQYFLIEAQPIHQSALHEFTLRHPNAQVLLAAAGEKAGKIYFDASDPFGGQAAYTPFPSHNIEVPIASIDQEIQTRKLPGPYLLKLDTHGFEVPILQGALTTLTEASVLIIECYNFKIAPECLLFFEICEYLKKFHFCCIDMVDPMYRLYDNSFWQMDLIFVKDTMPDVLYLSYR